MSDRIFKSTITFIFSYIYILTYAYLPSNDIHLFYLFLFVFFLLQNQQQQKSLPLLRQSLFTKELTIEGIKPPPHNVAFGHLTANSPVRTKIYLQI